MRFSKAGAERSGKVASLVGEVEVRNRAGQGGLGGAMEVLAGEWSGRIGNGEEAWIGNLTRWRALLRREAAFGRDGGAWIHFFPERTSAVTFGRKPTIPALFE